MGRSPCCEKAHTNKGAWTKEEDQRLINYIKTHGEGCWRSLPKSAGLLRCGKSCRLRWINYLRPDLKRGNFTEEEDELIIKLHSLLGNKWSLIAGRLPGRTDNEIKNYWNTHIKRKLLSRGLDPQTHRPINTAGGTITNNNYNISSSGSCTDQPEIITTSNGTSSMIKIESTTTNNLIHNGNYYSSSIKESTTNSNSTGTTVEEDNGHQTPKKEFNDDDDEGLNLDLSISLPTHRHKLSSSTNSAESKPFSEIFSYHKQLGVSSNHHQRQGGVCLCYKLGFQRNETCNCSSSNHHQTLNNPMMIASDLFRYYRPLNP
ncbi:hypothetical protein C5167_033100 [Papaver somniferum]|uniref:Uncharacterized protein n=1 Tax=Papaver somniferum TaxID=3469 RepID=A0A4Y7K9P9_PAPSO|nr:myb-related protein 308-like [Papaver somniferum]RZC68931.1 hypothetical protein C5167_033100 [Papaver somniferum]